MFDRVSLKQRAKANLRVGYGNAFVIGMIVTAAVAVISVIQPENFMHAAGKFLSGNSSEKPSIFFYMADYIYILISQIFLLTMLLIGEKKFYIQNAVNDKSIKHITYAFCGRRYTKLLPTVAVYVIIQTLLFYIPAYFSGLHPLFAFFCVLFTVLTIIISYMLFALPYLLAENPNLTTSRAVMLSIEMTSRYKGQIFVTHLSFIGWILLSLLTCGIGIIFVLPYIEATNAEIYIFLKGQAIASGMTSTDELVE